MAAFVEERYRRVLVNDLVDVAVSNGIPCRLRKLALRNWGDADLVQHFAVVVLGMIKDCDSLIRAY